MSDSGGAGPEPGFSREKPTGCWIRDHLDRAGPTYVAEMHRQFRAWCDERGYSAGSYASFRRYVWLLKEHRLLVADHTEPGDNPQFAERRYYRVAADADRDDPAWRDPQRERYGDR